MSDIHSTEQRGERHRTDNGVTTPATGRSTGAQALRQDPLVRRDLVRWGPVFAGLVTVIATLAILSSLGVAIGLSAIGPDAAGVSAIDTAGWIWGIVTAIVAFFLGGLVAAMSSAVGGSDRGLLNGVIVGCASITAMLLLIGFGAGTVLGAGASALGDVSNIGEQLGVSGTEIGDAVASAEDSAWATFIGLTLAVVVAGLGGLVGARGKAHDEPDRH